MDLKDIVTIALSSAGFCFGIASFAITFRQRALEDKRSIRKSLTDIVAELAKVDLANNQLNLDYPAAVDEKVVAFRRTYNGQRRYLANHGEFLAQQIDELTTDIDCMSLARAFDAVGDYDRASKFFDMSIDKSPSNALRATNLRGTARFWFVQGNAAKGRSLYQDALKLQLPDTDSFRRFNAETYLLWARVENEHGYPDEAQLVRQNAISTAKRIANSGMREEILGQITSSLPDPAK